MAKRGLPDEAPVGLRLDVMHSEALPVASIPNVDVSDAPSLRLPPVGLRDPLVGVNVAREHHINASLAQHLLHRVPHQGRLVMVCDVAVVPRRVHHSKDPRGHCPVDARELFLEPRLLLRPIREVRVRAQVDEAGRPRGVAVEEAAREPPPLADLLAALALISVVREARLVCLEGDVTARCLSVAEDLLEGAPVLVLDLDLVVPHGRLHRPRGEEGLKHGAPPVPAALLPVGVRQVSRDDRELLRVVGEHVHDSALRVGCLPKVSHDSEGQVLLGANLGQSRHRELPRRRPAGL
mmetsp:Transcript_67498/g.166738  ORF Transcript_67498/g.166738 Transcript_67498/m.166738 type:complete len:294 (+) Transcript_67498:285-1166(+)